MTKFLLIRHAATNAVGKRLSGRMEGVPLNEEGQIQAQKLAERLQQVPIDVIYSSPLDRAVQTAAPIAQLQQLETRVHNNFLEIDFGRWTNSTFDEVQKDPQFGLFNSFRSFTPIPEGETMLEAQARIIKGLQQLAQWHPQKTIAIVSHADLIKGAIAYFAGIPLDLFQRLEISPASVSIVELYAETARLLLINSTGEW